MTLTAPGCSMSDVIKAEVEQKLAALPEVREVKVEIVFDPPWDKSIMSEGAKLQLGFDSDYGAPPASPEPPNAGTIQGCSLTVSCPLLVTGLHCPARRPASPTACASRANPQIRCDSRQPGSTITCSSRYTRVPSSDSILRAPRCRSAFSFVPPLPIKIAFCPSRSQ